jgi:hypothetical protein
MSVQGYNDVIILWTDQFPPSVNDLYFYRRGPGFVLTEKGRRWKNQFKAGRGNLQPARLATLSLNRHGDFAILMYFYKPFAEIYNAGHESFVGFEKRDRRVKFRHKNWDDDGLIKVTKDATAELLGIPGDDRAFMSSSSHKRPIPPGGKEGVAIVVLELRLQDGGYDPFELDPDLLYAAIHGEA